MTDELLNPCRFTHLVTRDVQLKNLVIFVATLLWPSVGVKPNTWKK
jgi:hypothetical protein